MAVRRVVALGLLPGRALVDEAAAVRAAAPLVAFGTFNFRTVPKAGAVRRGAVLAEDGERFARTLAGVSADGRVLILVVADGYHPGVSLGFSPKEAAEVLQAAGARDGIFFDGGGSTTLVGRGDAGEAVVLNRPAGLQKTPGTLRYVGANLGITNLRRTREPLPALADGQAPAPVVGWNQLVTWARVYPYRAIGTAVGLTVAGFLTWWRWRRRLSGTPQNLTPSES